jgi:hypothetical protein
MLTELILHALELVNSTLSVALLDLESDFTLAWSNAHILLANNLVRIFLQIDLLRQRLKI